MTPEPITQLIIYENGNGFDFEIGDLVYAAFPQEVYKITKHYNHIHTQEAGQPHYIYAEGILIGSPHDITQEQWDNLPTVNAVCTGVKP